MLRGEDGNQARELTQLIDWLQTQHHPEVICLSNALLLGMARRLRSDLNAAVICSLQGEDAFLDSLPPPFREQCWATLKERAAEVDLFIAPSRYFGDLMGKRLDLPPERVQVVYNGISLQGYGEGGKSAAINTKELTLGYFARMCREKGLDTLVDAYIALRQRDRVKNVRLRIGGGCGPADVPFVDGLREKLKSAGYLGEVDFCPNVDHAAKVEFLRSLSLLSVPARFGEAFGLYLIEAMAAGVPVVQPRTAAFPELIEATGGGVLCEHENPVSLAAAVENLFLNPAHLLALGQSGYKAVQEKFTADAMAAKTFRVFTDAKSIRGGKRQAV